MELEVRLVAVPEPDITWFYNGKPIQSSDSVTVSTQSDMHMYSSSVSISKVKKSQEGVYQIIAKNREGQATLDIILKVSFCSLGFSLKIVRLIQGESLIVVN